MFVVRFDVPRPPPLSLCPSYHNDPLVPSFSSSSSLSFATLSLSRHCWPVLLGTDILYTLLKRYLTITIILSLQTVALLRFCFLPNPYHSLTLLHSDSLEHPLPPLPRHSSISNDSLTMDRLGYFATGIKGRVTRGTARVPSSMDFQDISDPTGTHTLHSTGARHPSRDRQQQQRSSSGQPSTGTFLQATSQRFTGLFTGQPSHAHNATSPALPPQPPLVNQVFPKPLNLRRNRTEIYRLQGLMKRNNASTYSTSSSLAEEDEFNASFSRVQIKPPENQTKIQALRHWLINEGARRIFFAVWVLVHALVFALGFVHYSLKGERGER